MPGITIAAVLATLGAKVAALSVAEIAQITGCAVVTAAKAKTEYDKQRAIRKQASSKGRKGR